MLNIRYFTCTAFSTIYIFPEYIFTITRIIIIVTFANDILVKCFEIKSFFSFFLILQTIKYMYFSSMLCEKRKEILEILP